MTVPDSPAATVITPKFPHITYKANRNTKDAWHLILEVEEALRRGGATLDEMSSFIRESKACKYDKVLSMLRRWVVVVLP